MLVYALLSLTVIRMLPIYLSLAGTGETTASKLFLGWFGPRGLASCVLWPTPSSARCTRAGPRH